MTPVSVADIVAVVGWGIAFALALALPSFGDSVYTRPVKWLFVIAAGLYLFISLSNFLEWAGVTAVLDQYEDYGEILFVPTVAYIGYALAAAHQVDAAMAAEARMRQEHLLLESVLETSPAGIMVVGSDGSISFASDTARELLGIDPASGSEPFSLGEDVSLGTEPGVPYQARRLLQELVARGSVQGLIRFVERPGGERVAVDISATRLPEGHGESVVTLTDVTERVRYRRELERAVDVRSRELLDMNERLRDANAAKQDFMARMSHELRTPLNSIIGFAGVLISGGAGKLNEEQARQLGMVRKSGQQLLDIVNDVLDMSVIEGERLKVTLSEIQVEPFLREVAESLRPQADDYGVDFVVEGGGCGCSVMTDADKLAQIVRNLLTNALKFTDPGGRVTLSFGHADSRCWIRVTDTGVGIRPEDLERVFQPFQQVDTPGRVKPQGTGLGLAISRDLAELIGGEITVSSAPGEGSRFTVELPDPGR